MGYYTAYTLKVLNGSPDLIGQFIDECEEARDALKRDGSYRDSVKWYSVFNDLIDFSRRHPSAVFALYAVGEEAGDDWVLYVSDGKVQRGAATKVYPPRPFVRHTFEE